MQDIGLEAMDGCALMNRVDTKYVLSTAQLSALLESVADRYRVLQVDQSRLSEYETLYFDTSDHQAYVQHHNAKLNRCKYRIRRYVASDVCFLEVKKKNNKGRTKKVRMPLNRWEETLSPESREYINQATGTMAELLPQLWVRFSRITLVAPELGERATLDVQLNFSFEGAEAAMPGIVIAEVKQAKVSANSPLRRALKKLGVREMRVSKYCLGSALLKPQLKHNRFKSRLNRVQKIANQKV